MDKLFKKALLGTAFVLGMTGIAKGQGQNSEQAFAKDSTNKESVEIKSEQESMLLADLQELESKTEKTPADEAEILKIKEQLKVESYDPDNK